MKILIIIFALSFSLIGCISNSIKVSNAENFDSFLLIQKETNNEYSATFKFSLETCHTNKTKKAQHMTTAKSNFYMPRMIVSANKWGNISVIDNSDKLEFTIKTKIGNDIIEFKQGSGTYFGIKIIAVADSDMVTATGIFTSITSNKKDQRIIIPFTLNVKLGVETQILQTKTEKNAK